jgi:hypothetical protein
MGISIRFDTVLVVLLLDALAIGLLLGVWAVLLLDVLDVDDSFIERTIVFEVSNINKIIFIFFMVAPFFIFYGRTVGKCNGL